MWYISSDMLLLALKCWTNSVVFTCLLMLMSKQSVTVKQAAKDMLIIVTGYLRTWLQSLQSHKNVPVISPIETHVFALWWIVVSMITWPLPHLFQMTPALTWENTVPCNAQWGTRGTILTVRCASAPFPCPSADLWPAPRPAPMDMCKYTEWPSGFSSPKPNTLICQLCFQRV